MAVAVDGDTLQAFAGQALHLALRAFRPVAHRTINWPASDEPVTDANPGTVGGTHRVRFRCSPRAERVGVAVIYQRGRASGTPYIRAELRDEAGLVSDPGVEWTPTDGTLPSTANGRGNQRVWEHAVLDTPTRTEATPAARTRPRLLNVAAADQGDTIEVRARPTTAARSQCTSSSTARARWRDGGRRLAGLSRQPPLPMRAPFLPESPTSLPRQREDAQTGARRGPVASRPSRLL